MLCLSLMNVVETKKVEKTNSVVNVGRRSETSFEGGISCLGEYREINKVTSFGNELSDQDLEEMKIMLEKVDV